MLVSACDVEVVSGGEVDATASCWGIHWQKPAFDTGFSLPETNMAMENPPFSVGKHLEKGPFSITMLVYQREI